MTGYLTKADPDEEGETVDLTIPNDEISNIFEEAVMRFIKDTLDRSIQKELMEALWNGDENTASLRMTDLLFQTISFHDYHEDFYHAFLTGIISGLIQSGKRIGTYRYRYQRETKKKRNDSGSKEIRQRRGYAKGRVGRKTADRG